MTVTRGLGLTLAEVKTTRDLAHLMFCARVALHLAWRDGRVIHVASEDRFLIDWLATAQRQKAVRQEYGGGYSVVTRRRSPPGRIETACGGLMGYQYGG
ncbi:hypothetical protein [Budvicia aquatica]|uniref:DUF2913 domain-containing protein n=1 Tax=Budvicia aquatica TaxID=82979 RepID=A0A484ZMS4_9GAMM|nr:hypothetical protein [Budvicia aquatica]VFS49051.1 Uncharacterised protein [Budvicia aquatica]